MSGVKEEPRIRIEQELHGKMVTLEELARQEYVNIQFSAGAIGGDPCEVIYLKIEPEGQEEIIHCMERHEALAILWVLSAAVWSSEVERAAKAGELA